MEPEKIKRILLASLNDLEEKDSFLFDNDLRERCIALVAINEWL
jgi:hypothetical protein